MLEDIKSTLWIRKLYRSRWFWRIRNAVRDLLPKKPVSYKISDDRDELDVAPQLLISWPEGRPRPRVGLVQDRKTPPYWTKYERFLRNNRFVFSYYDVHRSDWLEA